VEFRNTSLRTLFRNKNLIRIISFFEKIKAIFAEKIKFRFKDYFKKALIEKKFEKGFHQTLQNLLQCQPSRFDLIPKPLLYILQKNEASFPRQFCSN